MIEPESIRISAKKQFTKNNSGSLTIFPKALKNPLAVTRVINGVNCGVKYIELTHKVKAVVMKIIMAFKRRQSKKFVILYTEQINSAKENNNKKWDRSPVYEPEMNESNILKFTGIGFSPFPKIFLSCISRKGAALLFKSRFE